MAIDGTYGFVYCGVNGLGLGVFTVADGVFRGRDYGGGTYEGSAREIADGTIDLALSFEVRPGMFLVQGTAAQDAPHTRQIEVRLPPVFGDGKPQEIDARPGTIIAMIKRIPDEFARAVTEGFTIEIGQQQKG